MKRSRINALIRESETFFRDNVFSLPPFASWTPDEWAARGHEADERERNIVNSLWVDFDVMEAVNIRNEERYARAAAEITDWEEFGSDDPQVLLCAYGISARLCEGAVMRAEEAGVRLRLLRPKTVFPFPTTPIREWSERVDAMLVVELSMGQFVEFDGRTFGR